MGITIPRPPPMGGEVTNKRKQSAVQLYNCKTFSSFPAPKTKADN